VIAATAHRYPPGALPALNALLDRATVALTRQRPRPAGSTRPARTSEQPAALSAETEKAGLLFTGNPHESVPRRLLLDERLTPLERNAWQVFRLLLNDDGLTSFPTYEQLRPYLASTPFRLASRETVAKALTTLRLTRWISLAGRVRDEATGRMKGNIYLLHDEPVSISEAMLLDTNYLDLLGSAQTHANKAVREVAAFTLDEFQHDPHVRNHTVPTRVEILEQRVGRQSWATITDLAERPSESELGKNESELSEKRSVRNPAHPGSESEPSEKPGLCDPVRNPNSYCTSTYTDVSKSSVPRTRAEPDPGWPAAFHDLPFDERQKITIAMGFMPPQLQADVLAQWAARCGQNALRNPVGYLLRMIDKARDGRFNDLAQSPPVSRQAVLPPQPTRQPAPRPPAPCASKQPPTPEQREVARKAMAEIMRNMTSQPPSNRQKQGDSSGRK
jgi:hypothetical protein